MIFDTENILDNFVLVRSKNGASAIINNWNYSCKLVTLSFVLSVG